MENNMKPLLPNDKIIQDYRDLKSVNQLAIEYNCSEGRIKNILLKNDIPIRDKFNCCKKYFFSEDDKIKIIDLYINQNISATQIAKIFNYPKGIIKHLLAKKCNIFKPQKNKDIQTILTQNKDLIINLWHEHQTLYPIAEHFNCALVTISRFLDSLNIPRKKYNSIKDIPIEDRHKLHDLHYKELKTMKEIAQLYNVSPPTMATFFQKQNLSRRTKSEASTLVAQNPETVCKASRSMLTHKPYILPSGTIIKLQGYEPLFLDYIFQNNLLDEQEIVYHPPRIEYIINDNDKHYYFPDFFIPKYNLIIEIKSSWILKKQGIDIVARKKDATIKNNFKYLLILDNNFDEYKNIAR